jgi:hypothetical protein
MSRSLTPSPLARKGDVPLYRQIYEHSGMPSWMDNCRPVIDCLPAASSPNSSRRRAER